MVELGPLDDGPIDLDTGASLPEQPYGPGALCEDCGHFAERHQPSGCWFGDRRVVLGVEVVPCNCPGMLWLGARWPRPWLPAPEGLRIGV